MIKMLEKDIQNLMIEWLKRQKNVFVWRQNAGSMYVEGPTGRHGFRAASAAGISDIIGIWKGVPIAIEVKQPGKKPTELQRSFLKEFAAAGGFAIAVADLETLQLMLGKIKDKKTFEGAYYELVRPL